MGILIGIGGVSRAGKSELTKYLAQNLDGAEIIHQDSFVKSDDTPPLINSRIDWEHPHSINWDSLKKHISKSLDDNSYTILEGLFAFQNIELESQMSLKIQLTMDKSIFLARKKTDLRWGKEPNWFIEHIWKSHLLFGQPHSIKGLFKIHNISTDDYPSIIHKIQNN